MRAVLETLVTQSSDKYDFAFEALKKRRHSLALDAIKRQSVWNRHWSDLFVVMSDIQREATLGGKAPFFKNKRHLD
jgi:hypothetical protein